MNTINKHINYFPKVSVVVPVFNKEKFISECLQSVINQDYAIDSIEIVCINDGSTDNSKQVIEKYTKKIKNFKLIDQKNSGVCKARNVGMQSSTGKYIMFLDADDMISKNTISELVLLFEAHYQETDIVTYPVFYKKDNKLYPSKRCSQKKHKSIIKISEFPDICQTTMNVCIKNEKNKVLFIEGKKIYEDQYFNTEYIFRKKTIGWCPSAKYIYRKNIESSSSLLHPYYAFEDMLKLYYDLINLSNGDIDKVIYVHHLFLYDISWRIKSNWLFPYHLLNNPLSNTSQSNSKQNYKNRIDSLRKVFDEIDAKTIMDCEWILKTHKYYLLSLKTPGKIFTKIEDNSWKIYDINDEIITGKTIDVVFKRERIYKNTLYLMGFLKSPILLFVDKPKLKMHLNDEIFEIDLYPSSNSFDGSKIKTAKYWGFEIKCELSPGDEIKFEVIIESNIFKTSFWFQDWNNISTSLKKYIHYSEDISVKQNGNVLVCLEGKNKLQSYSQFKKSQRKISLKKYIQKSFARYLKKFRIWLYIDYINVFDNSYFQFCHDLQKKDGVLRFYIYYSKNKPESEKFNFIKRIHTIKNKSFLHRILFIAAEKIFTSYAGIGQFVPYKKSFAYYNELINFETIYLQHGVMHAEIDDLYAKDRSPFIDKIVASTHFEYSHFINDLHYNAEDILVTGQPRFQHENIKMRSHPKKILFAPSWRLYLVNWNGVSWDARDDFSKSEYYINFISFLRSAELINFLKINNLTLDIKLHPNFLIYKKYFDLNIKYIQLNDSIDICEYFCLITDFSSYEFDFLRAGIPILHYIPDYEKFIAGMHSYSRFIFPLNEVGAVCGSIDDIIKNLSSIKHNPQNYFKDLSSVFYDIDKPDHNIYIKMINT